MTIRPDTRRNRRPAPRLPRGAVRRVVSLVGAAAVAAGIVAWVGRSDDHHHDQVPPITTSVGTRPIFGDLFADHHHTGPAGPGEHAATHRHPGRPR